MTFREKLQIDHPDAISELYMGGCRSCPYDYNYCTANCPAIGSGGASETTCSACWGREMPEEKKPEEPVEIKIEEEKKMPRLSSIIRDAILNAIEDSAIEEAVEEAFKNYDYSDLITEAVEEYLEYNMSDIAADTVREAVRDYMSENL